MGATPAIAADELDPGRERRPLESYFQEIGGTRTLRREEEVILAKDLESATAQLRHVLYRLPVSARHVVARWDGLRALSHTGAKLSESMGDEETGEIAERVERAVKKLRALLTDREKHSDKAVPEANKSIEAHRHQDLQGDAERTPLSCGTRRTSRKRDPVWQATA